MKTQAYVICLGVLAFAANATDKETSIYELDAQCNSSVAAAQTCQGLLNHANLIGFDDLISYMHFVSVVTNAEFNDEPIANLSPIHENELYRQAIAVQKRGEPLSQNMLAELEELFDSRLAQEAQALGVAPNEVITRLDNYFRHQEFVDKQSSLDMVQSVSLATSSLNDDDEPKVKVTGVRLQGWGTGASFNLGVTQLIHEAGIYHGGPGYIDVKLEVSDASVYTYHMFKYKESTGAIPVGGWVECHECPPPSAIEIW